MSAECNDSILPFPLNDRAKERLEVEFIILRVFVMNKAANGVFAFPPVNIGTRKCPCFVDALSYDMSPMTSESLKVLVSTAGSDRLLLREFGKKSASFLPLPVFRTYELKRLIIELHASNPGLKF